MANENPRPGAEWAQNQADPAPAQSAQEQPSAPPRPGASVRTQPPVMPPAGGSAAPATAKKSNAPIIVTIMLLALLIFACFASCASKSSDSSVSLVGGDSVAVICMSGTIQYDGSECSPEGFKTLLDQAESDPSIKALVLRIDSGGGTATAGEEMTEYLKDFSKPVVVSSASINASAAYEISSQADYIFVGRSTEIGSIGTALQLMNYGDLLDMLGINVEVIASADSKDSSYGYRDLTNDEREQYQQMVDEINEMFIENVAEGRNMDISKVRELATGMPWAGGTAIELGIADEIGTLDDALDKAALLGGCSDSYQVTNLYMPSSNLDLLGLLTSSKSSTISPEDLAYALKELQTNGSDVQ